MLFSSCFLQQNMIFFRWIDGWFLDQIWATVAGGKAINAESVIGARFLLESYLDGDEAGKMWELSRMGHRIFSSEQKKWHKYTV